MPRVALWFFAVAPVYVLAGMGLGIYMGASDDHSLYPVHAHMNLLGWATMALCGTFYALARDASRILAWTSFALLNLGTLIMIPFLALVLKAGEQPQYILPLAVSELMLFGGMLSFALSVWGVLLKQSRGTVRGLATPTAAE